MAINILTEPQDPPISGDYTLDQAIQHAAETPQLSILTGWEETTSAPSGKQGAFIRHVANTFQIQGSDESISGSPASGINYIIATETSGVITLAWATDISAYSYNPAYGGIYDSSGNQALRDVCYLDGTDYYRGMCFGEDFNTVRLADGNLLSNGGLSVPGDLTVGGDAYISGDTYPTDSQSVSEVTINSTNDTYIIPRGVYMIYYTGTSFNGAELNHYDGSSWNEFAAVDGISSIDTFPATIFSDGINWRLEQRGSSGTADFVLVQG